MVKLFYFPGACSLASQIGLEEAGLGYDLEFVDLAADRTAYRKINPTGKVPALLVGEELVTENVAILTWAARQAPAKRLLPEETMAQVRAYSFLAWCSNTAHIARRQYRAPVRFTPDRSAHEALQAAGKEAFWNALRQIDERIGDKPWIGGADYSVCDCYAIVFYDWAVRDGHDVGKLPAYSRVVGEMTKRPAVRRALETHKSPLL
ncbi:MAG: glutathione S-transferase [Alphaproteobacteria bacterium]|nr:glutathione S-transferase [Alphaproteobacteria bacterium]